MANLTIVEASIELSGTDDHRIVKVVAGATLTGMQPVYKDSADDDEYKLSAASGGTATCDGLTLLGGTDGSPTLVITSGLVVVGATLVKGTTYVVSTTAGKIAPKSDLITGNELTELGVAVSTTELKVEIRNTGVAMP